MTTTDEKILKALIDEGLRIANDEPGWYWKCSDSDGNRVTLWVTDEPEKV